MPVFEVVSTLEVFSSSAYILLKSNTTPHKTVKHFDTIAQLSMGSLLTILITAGGQYILNNNAKDKCRLNPQLKLVYIDSFIGDTYTCRGYN